jgi:hypothetical protein
MTHQAKISREALFIFNNMGKATIVAKSNTEIGKPFGDAAAKPLDSRINQLLVLGPVSVALINGILCLRVPQTLNKKQKSRIPVRKWTNGMNKRSHTLKNMGATSP